MTAKKPRARERRPRTPRPTAKYSATEPSAARNPVQMNAYPRNIVFLHSARGRPGAGALLLLPLHFLVLRGAFHQQLVRVERAFLPPADGHDVARLVEVAR